MAVNRLVIRNPFCILKLVNLLFGLVIACTIAVLAAPAQHHLNKNCRECLFASDRFIIIVVYGISLFIWCLLTFLLFLFNVTARCQPGTLRGMELVACIFLILCAVLPFAYGLGATVRYKTLIDEITSMKATDLVFNFGYGRGTSTETEFIFQTNRKNAIQVFMNVCAVATAFIGMTFITLAVSAFLAHRSMFPGSDEVYDGIDGGAQAPVGGAYV